MEEKGATDEEDDAKADYHLLGLFVPQGDLSCDGELVHYDAEEDDADDGEDGVDNHPGAHGGVAVVLQDAHHKGHHSEHR